MIGGLKYNYSGASTFSSPPFECRNAVLTYKNIRGFSSICNFRGQLGPETGSINIENEPSILGTSDMPISPGRSISGSGVWTTQNFDGHAWRVTLNIMWWLLESLCSLVNKY